MTSLATTRSAPAPALSNARAVRQILLVSAGDRLHGLPLERSREIVESRPFTPLPGSEPFVQGLINVRGRLVTVLDLGAWLGDWPASEREDHCIVLLEREGRRVGLVVDNVVRILPVDADEIATAIEASLPVCAEAPSESDGDIVRWVFTMLDPDQIFRSVAL